MILDLILTLTATGHEPVATTITSAHTWVYVDGSFGAHVWKVGDDYKIRLGNDVADGTVAGTAEVQVEVEVPGHRVDFRNVPRAWVQHRSPDEFATGPLRNPIDPSYARIPPFVIPSRAAIRLDVTVDAYDEPKQVSEFMTFGAINYEFASKNVLTFPVRFQQVGRVGGLWLSAIREGTAPAPIGGEEMAGCFGPWFVLGNKITNEGGANQIAPCPVTPDAETVLLRAWGTMNRMAIGCLGKADGMPVPSPLWPGYGYSLSGATARSSTLPKFHEDMEGASDPSKVQPRNWCGPTASAPYQTDLMGDRYDNGAGWVTWVGGYERHDGQHLIRALAPIVAASQVYGDPIATFDLRVLNAEVRRSYTDAPVGHTAYGTREVAWAQYTCLAAGDRIGKLFARRANRMRGESGTCAIFPWIPTEWSFNPSPWHPSEAVPTPLPTSKAVAQRMEEEFQVIAGLAAGDYPGALQYLEGIYTNPGSIVRTLGYAPKWLVTGETKNNETVPVDQVTMSAGGQDYFPWTLIGAGWVYARAHNLDETPWKQASLIIPVEGMGRVAKDLSELKQWFTTNPDTYNRLRYQIPAIMTVLP